jgi:predicted nucleic acid-binding protein
MALIVDTGPLFAALDRDDAHHDTCRRLFQQADEPLVIPAPVLVEVAFLVDRSLHPGAFVALLDDIANGGYLIEELRIEDYRRIRDLCERYEDADIGFVDAAVLAVVERLNEPKLATLDRRHFHTLRPRHVDALQLIP